MMKVLLIGAGGALGSILRYAVASAIQRAAGGPFPAGTLVVNLVGCLVIGLLSYLGESRAAFSPELQALIFIGLLGGFTTFSTFGNDSVGLVRAGRTELATLYVAAHVIAGLGAVWLGRGLGRLIWR